MLGANFGRKTPETSIGAYVGRNLCAKKARAPDFRASKILKSSAQQLRPKVGRVGRVVKKRRGFRKPEN